MAPDAIQSRSTFIVDSNIDMNTMESSSSLASDLATRLNSIMMNTVSNNNNNNSTGNTSDAFDGSAEPTVYMSENRMPVFVELDDALVYIIFVALLLALLSILPGVRRAKLASFIGILSVLGVGASILLALSGTNWMTGDVSIREAPYSALTSETISGKLQVNIGLSSTNVTLAGKLMRNNLTSASKQEDDETVYYNERFHWYEPDRLAQEHEDALRKGLPYPILTVTEFLSQDSDGFNWMRQLRYAGRNATLALYAALVSWCLTAVVMCLLPVYLPHMMQITGAIMMLVVWIYTMIIQSPKAFMIHINANQIEFAFGDTYMITFMAGAMSMLAGILLFLLQIANNKSPNGSQLTIMDSESFVNDQKALSAQGSIRWLFYSHKNQMQSKSEDSVSSCSSRSDNDSVLKSGSISSANSVIIPIADIEEKFQRATNESRVRVEHLGSL